MSHRRRIFWWVLFPIPLIVLAGLGIFGSAWVKAGRILEKERCAVEARIAELKSERVLRPVVYEPAEEGNGWDLLAPALAVIGSLSDEELVGFPSFSDDDVPVPDPDKIEALIVKIRPHLESLRHSLRRSWVEPSYNYKDLLSQQMPWLAQSIKTSKVLRDAARHCHRHRHYDVALDFIVISLGLADRVAVKSFVIQELVANVIRSVAMEPLKEMLADHNLSTADLRRLNQVLRDLDPRPEVESRWNSREDLYFRQTIVNLMDRPELAGKVDATPVASVRHFFSLRIMLAECFEEQDRYMKGLEPVASRSLGERSNAAKGYIAAFERKTIMHALLIPQVGRVWHNLAAQAMDYRLARVSVAAALHHAETGNYPITLNELVPKYLSDVPVDSYGGAPFAYAQAEGGVRIASQTRDPEFVEGISMPDELYDANGYHVWRVKARK